MSLHHDDDLVSNVSNNPHLDDVINLALANPKRRDFIKAGAASAGLLFITGCGGGGSSAIAASPTVQSLGFSTTSTQTGSPDLMALLDDNVKLPAGYTYEVLYRTGDPLLTNDPLGNALRADYNGNDYTANVADYPASSWLYRSGDHHDGGEYFGMSATGRFDPEANDRAVMAINHENVSGTAQFIHGIATSSITTNPRQDITVGTSTTTAADQIRKEVHAHGVGVFEVRRDPASKRYAVVLDSPFNKRYTAGSVMSMAGGPSDVKKYFITRFSQDGSLTRGTVNNCASGYTPWGTYLTCEENWPFYFRSGVQANATDGKTADKVQGRQLRLARYGLAGVDAAGTAFTSTTGSEKFWSSGGVEDEFARWDITPGTGSATADYRNAANTFGYVVEIDPFNPDAVPRKRVAMGRFYHEGAWLGPVEAGKPIVYYMGCDSRNEYIYKFVSARNWNPADASLGILAGDLYLNDGKLFVARFKSDGTGEWLELSKSAVDADAARARLTGAYAGFTFTDAADVLIHTRIAADAVGGTRMDRPEWGAVNPRNGEVYFTLTKSSRRQPITDAGTQTQGAFVNPMGTGASGNNDRAIFVDAANPRGYVDVRADGTDTGSAQNANGHIIRFAETGRNPAASTFKWDIYLFGAEIRNTKDGVNVSSLNENQDFSAPDGCWFSEKTGILWIQTDDDAYTDVSNCMLLASIPGTVGDGGPVRIGGVDSFKGKNLGPSALRRFLVGPRDAEITGLMESPDGKTLFVNIQHPGENTGSNTSNPPRTGTTVNSPSSSWPQPNTDPKVGNNASGMPTGNSFPRSATIAIYRTDGGLIGGDLG